MHENVLAYEPHLALFVDDNDALKFYLAIAKWALQHLTASGHLYFEINETKNQELITMLEKLGFTEITVKKDLFEKHRMIRCMKK